MSSESSMVSFGLSATSQRYFYLKTNHFSLKTNQPPTISSTFLSEQISTSQTNMP
jgi:hypothetical protein